MYYTVKDIIEKKYMYNLYKSLGRVAGMKYLKNAKFTNNRCNRLFHKHKISTSVFICEYMFSVKSTALLIIK